MSASDTPLVEVEGLVHHFRSGEHLVRAVDGVTLSIAPGETLGLVGESGCGKSTLGRAMLRGFRVTAGQIRFEDRDITHLEGRQLRAVRRGMQMVFQDPLASLNPLMRVGKIVAEPLRAHRVVPRERVAARVEELFGLVALDPALRRRLPGELSGGQRQRVAIARALAVEPRFIVADEAVAALDVSVGAQVINLFEELRARLALSYLFVSHDLGVVRRISDRVAVMYLGKIVETGPTHALFEDPAHPYTVALLSASPSSHHSGALRRERIILGGDPPSPIHPPPGCRFHTRCPIGPTVHPERTVCIEQEPALTIAEPGHQVACHFARELTWPASHIQPALSTTPT